MKNKFAQAAQGGDQEFKPLNGGGGDIKPVRDEVEEFKPAAAKMSGVEY